MSGVRISKKRKKEILKTIRDVQGLNWIQPLAAIPNRKEREAAIAPILATISDPQTRKAVQLVAQYGKANLVEMVGGKESLYRRLYSWQWFLEYMRPFNAERRLAA